MSKPTGFGRLFMTRLFRLLCPATLIAVFLLSGCGGGGGSGSGGKQSTQSANIVITNDMSQARKQGAFSSVDGYLSRSSKVLKGDAQSSVVFSPDLSSQGYYRIYLWWPQAAQGAGVVDVTVRHMGGSTRLTVDQSTLGGQWNAIGVYQLAPGNTAEVEIASRAGVPALVDAARFEYVGDTLPALTLSDSTLPIAEKGIAYSAKIDVLGGSAPYTRTLSQGQLPPGLTIDANGSISGTPVLLGKYPFSILVRDSAGQQIAKDIEINVLESATAPLGTRQESNFTGRKHAQEAPPAGTPPDLSALVNVIAALPEGEWSKVNLNNYSDVWTPDDLRPLYFASNPPPSKIIEAWSSFAWDPNRGDLMLFGGGHANYNGNDVYRWRGSTRQWERASLPSEVKQDDLGTWMAVDGPDAAPISAHTYDNNIFLPVIDRLVVFGGAAFNSGGAFTREVTPTTSRRTGPYFFDPNKADPNKVGGTTGSHVKRTGPHPEIVGGNMWTNRDIYLNLANNQSLPGAHVNGCTAYAQENGKDVVYVGARPPGGGTSTNLYKYTVNDINNPAADNWQQVGLYWVGSAAQTACAFDSTRKILLRIGDNSSAPLTYWNLNTPGGSNIDVAVIPADPTGEFAALMSKPNLVNCGLDADPIRKDFALWCGDGRVWKIKPPATLGASGWTVTKQRTPSFSVPNGDVGTGILGKWKYIYNLDAFMGLQDASQGNIWIYKPVGWQNPSGNLNTPPTVSLTSPATGQTFKSGDVINLTANATDSDGTIAKVEYFMGSTKIGEALAFPYTFAWSGAPAGNLSLMAIATDNKGAQAVSSSISITVQPGPTGTVVLQDGTGNYSLTRDTYLSYFYQTSPLGGATSLMDQYSAYSNLIRFGIFVAEGGPVPNGAVIQSATLSLYKYSYYDMTYALNRMLVNWSETNATWKQRDTGLPWNADGAQGNGTDFMSTADSQIAVGFNPGWMQFDVTAALRQMSSGQPNYGWRLRGLSGNASNIKNFYSREATADPTLRPKLTVTYSTQ